MDEEHDARVLSDIRADLRVLKIARTFPARIRGLSKTPAHRVPRHDTITLNYEQEGISMTMSWQMGGLKEDATMELRG